MPQRASPCRRIWTCGPYHQVCWIIWDYITACHGLGNSPHQFASLDRFGLIDKIRRLDNIYFIRSIRSRAILSPRKSRRLWPLRGGRLIRKTIDRWLHTDLKSLLWRRHRHHWPGDCRLGLFVLATQWGLNYCVHFAVIHLFDSARIWVIAHATGSLWAPTIYKLGFCTSKVALINGGSVPQLS
jgi:hypothetical protein